MYESPFTSYFFVKNRLNMLTEPLLNITKKFAILLGAKNVAWLITLLPSRDTRYAKLFAENKGKSRFYCFFKNNFVY